MSLIPGGNSWLTGHSANLRRGTWGDLSFVSDSWNKVKREREAGYYPPGSVSKTVDDWVKSGRPDMRRRGMKRFKRKRSFKRRRGAKYSNPSTLFHDRNFLYSRKGGNRKGFRRWRKFERKVEKVIDKSLGDQIVVRWSRNTFNTSAGQKGYFAWYVNGASDDVFPDLDACFTYVNNNSAVNTMKADVLFVESVRATLTLLNPDTAESPTYITLYYFKCRRNLQIAPGITDVILKLSDALSKNNLFTAVGSPPPPNPQAISINSVMSSPFQAGQWCQHFLITKVVRIRLDVGQQSQLDLSSKRYFRVRNEDISNNIAVKGVTHGVLMEFVGTLDPSTDEPSATSTVWNFQRTYNCRHMVDSANKLGFIADGPLS